MKVGKIRTLWIMLLTAAATINICSRAIFKVHFSTLRRDWVDQILRKWAQRLLNIVQATHQVFNPHQINLQDKLTTIIMVNHSTHYDIPLTFMALPGSMRMLAKKELFRIPIFGPAIKYAEFVSIDRQHPTKAAKDLAVARQKIQDGIILWIAPEGTRSKTGKLGRFKKGGFTLAIQAKARIVPITLCGAREILPTKTWNFHIKQHVDIHVGKPIDAGEYNLETRTELMEAVRTEMESKLSPHPCHSREGGNDNSMDVAKRHL